MIKESCQLDQVVFPGKPVVEPIELSTLTPQEIREALEAVSLIKEKRSGVVKGCTCANGSKQRKYLKEGDCVVSLTVSVEAMIALMLMKGDLLGALISLVCIYVLQCQMINKLLWY